MAERTYHMAKFNGENFALWKFQAQMVLQAMDLWNATQAPQPSLEEPNKRAEWLKANQKAFSVVCLGLELPQLAKVTTLTTVKEVFETLSKEFEAKTKDNQLHVKMQLFSFKLQVDESLREGLAHFDKIICCLCAIGGSVEDENAALLLLLGLPDTYMPLRYALCVSGEALTLDQVRATLLNEGVTGTLLQPKTEALNTEDHKGKGKYKDYVCHECGQTGHIQRYCPERKKEKGKGKGVPKERHFAC